MVENPAKMILAWNETRNHISANKIALLSLDVPIRVAQFAADRIAPIRSDLKSQDSNRNPKFRSIRCDVFDICQMFWVLQIARFDSRDSVR